MELLCRLNNAKVLIVAVTLKAPWLRRMNTSPSKQRFFILTSDQDTKPKSEFRLRFRLNDQMTLFLFWTRCSRCHFCKTSSQATPSLLQRSWPCNRRNYIMKQSFQSFSHFFSQSPEYESLDCHKSVISCYWSSDALEDTAERYFHISVTANQRGHKKFHYYKFCQLC